MKFPRTPHIPGSTATEDDIFVDVSLTHTGEFVATEKMDGSNVMIDRHGAYARNGKAPSADWFYPARDLFHNIGHMIDEGLIIVGELLTWRKCIAYEDLPGDFMLFSVIDNGVILSWDDVAEYGSLLDLPVVPVIARGSFDKVVESSMSKLQAKADSMEGFVVRNTDAFPVDDYASNVAKFVGSWHSPVAGNVGRNGVSD